MLGAPIKVKHMDMLNFSCPWKRNTICISMVNTPICLNFIGEPYVLSFAYCIYALSLATLVEQLSRCL